MPLPSGLHRSRKPIVCTIGFANGSWLIRTNGKPDLHLEPLFSICAWNVTLLAEAIGMEIRDFRRMAIRDLGLNPKEWLRRTRIVAAMHLLREGGKIEIVARQLGFRHASDFTNEFRMLVKVTPSYYVRSEMSRAFLAHSK